MDVKKIGNAIKYLRKRAGYTQQELAERLLVSDKAVSRWERGIGIPDISLLRRLSIILDTDIDSLLEGSVAYHEIAWKGLLYLNERATVQIYDKPFFEYLLSNFLLVKIRDVIVFCDKTQQSELIEQYGSGELLGISLTYCCIDTQRDISQNIVQYKELFASSNVMIIYGSDLLYGVNLSRFLERGLINAGKITVMAVTKKDLNREISIDENRCIVREMSENKLVTKYQYSWIPILFCHGGIKAILNYSFDSVSKLISMLTDDGILYAELMDKGFIDIEIDDAEAIYDATSLVRIIQKETGSALCCVKEIAYRRGLISG